MANRKNYHKELIRRQIITSAQVYSNNLSGKTFLYVYGNEYFEILFPVYAFRHLTGVESKCRAKQFYNLAKNNKLTTNQFWFNSSDYSSIKKKLPCLNQLPVITNSLVCVVKDLTTATYTYKIGLTNLEFTLCLTSDIDDNGNMRSHYQIPMSLRTNDSAIENSSNGDFIDFIFIKDATEQTYSKLSFSCEDKPIPQVIQSLIDEKFYKALV